jgi:hypothetical protein
MTTRKSATTAPEREELLKTIAKHAVDGRYVFRDRIELKILVSNKLGHDLPESEITTLERYIREVRSGE